LLGIFIIEVFVVLRTPVCKACGRPDKFDFHVPDDIWKRVVPEKLQNSVVCLSCFDEFARLTGTDYDIYIEKLYFKGERGSIIFTALSEW